MRTFLLLLFLGLINPLFGQQPGNRPAPRGVVVKADLSYAGNDNPRQKLDLCLPEKPASSKLPVIVFIHGGAWSAGDRKGGIGQLAPYVSTGRFAGVTVGYRLSQEAIWPAQIHDCKAALRWVRANAAAHGLDPDRIAVWGSSAGGHLVAMLGTTAGMPEFDGKIGPNASFSTKVSGVLNYFGPSELLTMQAQSKLKGPINHDAPDSPESRLLGGPILENKAKAAQASPLTHVTKDDAPTLMIHGDADPIVPHEQSVVMLAALKKVGVPAELHSVKGGAHGKFDDPQVGEKTAAFLERILYPVKTSETK